MKDLTLEQVMQKHSDACAKSVNYRLEADAFIAEMKRRLKERNKTQEKIHKSKGVTK